MVSSATKPRVLEHMQRTQADVICLYLNAKRYHWYTYGPLFRELHLLFDEIAAVANGQIDPFGERLRILGGDPISSPDEIKTAASVAMSSSKHSLSEMLSEALANERHIIQEMKEGASLAEEDNDPGSVDLYSRSIQDHEKYAWFLDETLRRVDGVIT
ncbi:MAG: DNA starvation/stationary phase protection protein [Dehalococcoidia bacterium]|nr:DNA starvation/stationary phase protection protein [Dehalococcoidia bacterium]